MDKYESRNHVIMHKHVIMNNVITLINRQTEKRGNIYNIRIVCLIRSPLNRNLIELNVVF